MAILVSCITCIDNKFSGYFAEILRSGFESTSKGQIEAANALNLNRYFIFRKNYFASNYN